MVGGFLAMWRWVLEWFLWFLMNNVSDWVVQVRMQLLMNDVEERKKAEGCVARSSVYYITKGLRVPLSWKLETESAAGLHY
jgi:hypothetical protein